MRWAWLCCCALLVGCAAFPQALDNSPRALARAGLQAFHDGHYLVAIDRYESAAELQRQRGDAHGRAANLNNLARLHNLVGDYTAALAALAAAQTIAEELNDAALLASGHINRGLLLLNRRAYDEADAALQLALVAADQARRRDLRADALTVLGAVYRQQGDFERALENYQKALTLNQRLRRAQETATSLRVLGEAYLYRVQGERGDNLQRAVRLIEQAESSHTQQRDALGLAMAVSHLGEHAYLTRRYDVAIARYTTALETFTARGFPDGIGRMHIHLGYAHSDAGRLAQAMTHFDRAMALYRGLDDREWLRVALFGKAQALERSGDIALAETHYRQAVEVFESIRGDVSGGEPAQALFTRVNKQLYENLVALLVARGAVEEALEYVERSRLRALRDYLLSTPAKARRSRGDDLPTLVTLTREDAYLRAQRRNAPDPAVRERLAVTLAENERAAAKVVLDLSARYRGIDHTLDVVPNTRRLRHSAAFPVDLALVTYFITEESLYIFVIKKDARVSVRLVPVSATTLAAEVTTALLQLGRASLTPFPREGAARAEQATLVEPLERLYRYLVAPVEDVLGHDINTVAVLPVKWLHYLPFGALLTHTDNGRRLFWQERKRIVYLSANSYADALLDAGRDGGLSSRDSVIAFGNPDLGDPRRALPYAALEVREIARHFPTSMVLTEKEATKSKFTAQWGRHRVVHVAAHAHLDENRAALLLAPGAAGVVAMEELFDLPANRHTALMVLSACQTAVDPALARLLWQGEAGPLLAPNGAVSSAAHSLLLLGIPAVTATLWKVDDQASALLMGYFYEHLAQGMDIARALQAAQRQMQNRSDAYSQPYYWAAFVTYGMLPGSGP